MVDKELKESWEDFQKWDPTDGIYHNINTASVFESATVHGELFDMDKDLRKKYPALEKAYKQYQTIKELCLSKEKENEIR
tara:strand:- start:61 stop:300 length:240 start_codon:yes stop_codon:yes gene_type:complete